MSRVPIVVILGATGTGKSKLAIQLAKKFCGEIVGADSMQVYEGLNIISNKVTSPEMEGIPHHMLDIVQPVNRFTVFDYRNRAIPIIENILKRKKLPIIVGGTNYYIESILWHVLVEKLSKSHDEESNQELSLINDVKRVSRVTEEVLLTNNKQLFDSYNDYCWNCCNENETSENVYENILLEIDKFKMCLKLLSEIIEIPSSYYRNTFYPIDNKGSQINLENLDKNIGKDDTFDLMKIELKFIGNFLRNWLKTDNREFEDVKLYFNSINGIDVKTTPTVDEVISDLKHLESLEILKKILNGLRNVTKTRIKRLRLIRIIDDEKMKEFSNEDLYMELRLVDPNLISVIHPNNRRKIVRSLQVYLMFGRQLSDIMKEQKSLDGGSSLGGPMRFPNACVFWLKCEQDTLMKRLDGRVDEMIKMGMIEELQDFHRKYNKQRILKSLKADYTAGIFQTIGLKEFHEYLMLSDEKRNSEIGKKLYEEGLERVKLVTKRYAKYQVKWIMNRFIRVPSRQVPPIYGLDCTDTEKWKENVEEKATKILSDYLNNVEISEKPLELETPHINRFKGGEYKCEICKRVFIGLFQWEVHLESKRHKKVVDSKRSKLKMLQEEIRATRNSM